MNRHALAASIALVAAGLTTAGCYNPEDAGPITHTTYVQDWRNEVIYQILTDRFGNGDTSNDWGVHPNDLARYHGGDWKGIEDNLDYLQELGVTTLWISPIIKNVDSDASIDGYHGYWAQDLTALNAHMGDLGSLRSMVDTAHVKGMKVILDIVTNHVGQVFFYDINGNGVPDEAVWGGGDMGQVTTPISHHTEYDPEYEEPQVMARTSLGVAGPAPVIFFNDARSNHMAPVSGYTIPGTTDDPLSIAFGYNQRGRVYDWNVPNQVLYGDFPGGLKDVKTEWKEVRNAMFYAYGRWMSLVDFDGFRIDTLKHVDHGFWQDFAPRIRQHAASLGKKRFFMFGEAFDGDDAKIGSYTTTNEVDSVFYFSQKFTIDDVFKRGRSTVRMKELFDQRTVNYGGAPQQNGVEQPPTKMLVNFLDNHDVARFLYDKPSVPALHSALVFLFAEDGIPCVYYGTEQQFTGGNDPSNREDLWRTGYSKTNATYQFIRTLIGIRKQHVALRQGDMVYRAWTPTPAVDPENDYTQAGVLAFERFTNDERVLVVFNTHDTEKRPAVQADNTPMVTGFAAGTTLVNVVPDEDPTDEVTVGAGGVVQLELAARAAKIFVAK